MATTNEITWGQWLVYTNDVKELWARQPTYIISQAVYMLAGVLTLLHAFRKGGRWPYFWLATVLHGLWTDNFWHFVLPEYDNFWHSQTPVMLLGGRLPLHIVLLYPAFIYHAAYAVSRLNLPCHVEPFAVGLVTVLIDIPYDIVAVKFVHWTWHDTDPNVFDRHYWVPWNSYYFHAAFTAAFVYVFHATRKASNVERWESASKLGEWTSVLISSLFSMPCGVLMFISIYHPLHDMFNIHSEVTFFLLFAIFASIVISGLLREREKPAKKLTVIDRVLIVQLAIHYIIYLTFVIFFDPEREVSIGLHEPVGPCNEKASLVTPFGQTLYKRKYFCPQNYDEKYFDFHCVRELPPPGATWYTICGTPFENRAEYITVLTTILIAAVGVFYNIYTYGASTEPAPKAKQQKLKKK